MGDGRLLALGREQLMHWLGNALPFVVKKDRSGMGGCKPLRGIWPWLRYVFFWLVCCLRLFVISADHIRGKLPAINVALLMLAGSLPAVVWCLLLT